ncbi:hypothetical protein PMZ80_006513 [Knufia obscura]|uniref:Rhamnogalacturonase A/B/Epimerase-like pectate lyase domain-containing protein n=2 Tax=Knufia TaxID=430999 RepID=A0AAN8IK67_9EURO|nr:hypothetical protein PMZ80_006513 [Knufia obscura]KAK5950872.1 hypothetical protein OHC33_007943 [Knufia fluminis]
MSLFTKPLTAITFILLLTSTLVSAKHGVRTQIQPRFESLRRGVNSTHPSYANASCSYWLEEINHQGIAPFQNDSSYEIFRNVKDFGAIGDGITDDTAAINLAISQGNRCAPGSCASSTTTPAVVYFPAGTYLVSGDIIDYYYTTLYGNPNCLPTIKVSQNYTGSFVIDGDPYGANGLSYGATNVFWRQIRNLIIDTTSVPATTQAVGIHWPTGQATSISNVVFRLNEQPGTQHWGLFIEEGSGGFLSDLIFIGGLYGANVGNQQFTSRNFTFYNCVTAINQLWDWGWTYQQISFNNVSVGLNMSSGGVSDQAVGSIVMFDSEFYDVDVGILHAHTANAYPPAAGALILENVDFTNVGVAVQGPNGTDVPGSTSSFNVPAWAQGHAYSPFSSNFTELHGYITPNLRSPALMSNGKYYTRPKPQYGDWPVSQILSARSAGAKGDGRTDDTAALQKAIDTAASQRKILFIDGGDYIVTSTLYVPAGSKIVGEVFPVILATGTFWSDISNPLPVVQVGQVGEVGQVEWTDCILSTRGPAPGAIMVEWNLASANAPQYSSAPTGWTGQGQYGYGKPEALGPSGIWEVHTRIGGFTGSDLSIADCPASETRNISIPPNEIEQKCIAAAASMIVTSSARNLYMEGNWLWVADHDAEDPQLRQITVYAGRGLNIESNYAVWLVGTSVEHHSLYEYQFVNTQDVFAGHIQTETAYYQPNPPASIPFPAIAALSDPTFPDYCLNGSSFLDPDLILQPNQLHNDCDGWGLRIVDSFNMYIYGAGHYSFFYDYNVTCSQQGYGSECQSRMVSLESSSQNVGIYGLSTVGTQNMVTYNGRDIVPAADNMAGFTNTIALFRPGQV